MPRRKNLIKITDESTPLRCATGSGAIREEVWVDSDGVVTRFNLAFICFGLYRGDNGRVLGYDTAHGFLHRHFAGAVEPFPYMPYDKVLQHFSAEVGELKQRRKL